MSRAWQLGLDLGKLVRLWGGQGLSSRRRLCRWVQGSRGGWSLQLWMRQAQLELLLPFMVG